MSAFLGPIHFWLYNKIQFQENLIDELVAYVTAKGWSDKADQYVSTDRRKLDEVIDEANIHGWLQSRIHDAEAATPPWFSMQPATMPKNSTP